MRIAASAYPMTFQPTPTADELRAAFDAPAPLTLGLEEEIMLLDPETLDLLPRAADVIDAAGDPRFKLELRGGGAATSPPPPRRSGGWRPPACIPSPRRSGS